MGQLLGLWSSPEGPTFETQSSDWVSRTASSCRPGSGCWETSAAHPGPGPSASLNCPWQGCPLRRNLCGHPRSGWAGSWPPPGRTGLISEHPPSGSLSWGLCCRSRRLGWGPQAPYGALGSRLQAPSESCCRFDCCSHSSSKSPGACWCSPMLCAQARLVTFSERSQAPRSC